jgi:hypothetical protein
MSAAQGETMAEISKMPLWAGYTMAALGISISVISAIYMLKGKNWARKLFLVWIVVSVSIGFLVANNYMHLTI